MRSYASSRLGVFPLGILMLGAAAPANSSEGGGFSLAEMRDSKEITEDLIAGVVRREPGEETHYGDSLMLFSKNGDLVFEGPPHGDYNIHIENVRAVDLDRDSQKEIIYAASGEGGRDDNYMNIVYKEDKEYKPIHFGPYYKYEIKDVWGGEEKEVVCKFRSKKVIAYPDEFKPDIVFAQQVISFKDGEVSSPDPDKKTKKYLKGVRAKIEHHLKVAKQKKDQGFLYEMYLSTLKDLKENGILRKRCELD